MKSDIWFYSAQGQVLLWPGTTGGVNTGVAGVTAPWHSECPVFTIAIHPVFFTLTRSDNEIKSFRLFLVHTGTARQWLTQELLYCLCWNRRDLLWKNCHVWPSVACRGFMRAPQHPSAGEAGEEAAHNKHILFVKQTCPRLHIITLTWTKRLFLLGSASRLPRLVC